MLYAKFSCNHSDYWFQRTTKDFYHVWAWRPSWAYDSDAVNKISFTLSKEAPHKIGFDRPSGFGRTFEHCERRTNVGRNPYKLTYEPLAQVS